NVLRLTFVVIGVLLLLSFVPPFTIGNTKLRRINLLTDIQKDKPKPVAKIDTTKKKIVIKPPIKNKSCPEGITCIEDYSDNKKALSQFFKSLNQVKTKPLRIAFFGDSFIEGDILAGNFRDTLQLLFGGQGVGYVPIATDAAQFRTTILHSFSNWSTFSFVGHKSPYSPLGTPGYCFVPQDENELEYKPGKRRFINKFNRVRLFYSSTQSDSLHYTLNDTIHHSVALPTADSLSQFTIQASEAKAIKFNFHPHDSLKVYGLSFDDETGIYVDNFAMRGNSGTGLLQVSSEMHKKFNEYQNYSLIILQYGLNVVSESDSSGYIWYAQKMIRAVNRLKESFPNTSILLVSVSDRSSNHDGKFSTMIGIEDMRNVQREIARQCKVAFWDLYSAMGGENSMLKYVEATPPLASKDYTHLTYHGGRKLARQLAETLLVERKRYVPKKK
ncbi:MAG TPA: hypothetical protein VIT44_00465, partial [Cyclobacteriaceae bacterium]